MTDVHVPSGFVARAIEPDADSESVTELCAAAAIAEYGTADVTLEMVLESYNSPSFNPTTDGRLVIDPQGRLAGVAEFYDSDADHVSPFVFVRVRPDLLESGVVEALLSWAERRGQDALELAAPDLRVGLRASAAGVNLSMHSFEQSGWVLERVFWTMEIDFGPDEPVAPTLPSGIRIRQAIAREDDRAIHAAQDEAFADHFGNLARSHDDWLHFMTKIIPYDPSLWFLAVEGDQIVGTALCLIEAPGRPELGWVNTLGVRPAWRGRGLGTALLLHAFAELHQRGKRHVGLGVDSQSLTGATRLYERAGMHVTRDERSYARVLRDGREIRPM